MVFFGEIIALLEQQMHHQFFVQVVAELAAVPELGVCHHYHSSIKSLVKRKTCRLGFSLFFLKLLN